MGDTRETTINRILEVEVKMFLRVPSQDEAACRAHMEDMKLHRRGQFASWSDATLESYLDDLTVADKCGDNLMTIKYARMDGLIPPRSTNPRVDDISRRFCAWQEEFIRDYPNIMRGGRDMGDFANYLHCELETYSDTTLELLWQDVQRCEETGLNMSAEVYAHLARQSGYDSLESMEKSFG